VKICDLTQFYSPVSGGVKRYLAEKVRYLREHSPGDEHILIIPGAHDVCMREAAHRVYTIRSPLISRTSQYRALLRLEAIERILERERPDIIESGDPYQVGWKAVHSGRGLEIPVVGFYHSHFPEAYLRSAQKFLGKTATEFILDLSRRYVRSLYSSFARTMVPSPALADVLRGWGVPRVVTTDLGVDAAIFHPDEAAGDATRKRLGLSRDEKLLLYVGRLAMEKNTHTLFEAYRHVAALEPRARLLIIGDGLQRAELDQLRAGHPEVRWLSYCGDPRELADYYRAADLFVHPGVQETFGLVTLEAQACGTPVVGIRGSYMDRIIYGGQEHWAGANTAPALAGAIVRSLGVPADRAALAAEMTNRYSWRKVFDGLFGLYREVISEYRSAPHE
jgi:alpha-1,6-mannosyltransferase